MTRGPVSEQAIEWALPIARLRGTVYCFRGERECPCDFEIINNREHVYVRVRRTRNFHRSAAELEAEYCDAVLRLRAMPKPPSVFRELWVCSRYGRWRFFRITESGLEEYKGSVPEIRADRVSA